VAKVPKEPKVSKDSKVAEVKRLAKLLLQFRDVGERAVLVGEIQTVPDHPNVRNLETQVLNRDI
jgi:hypothetical protein